MVHILQACTHCQHVKQVDLPVSVLSSGLAESTHTVLQFLLEEQAPGFTTSSQVLWQLVLSWWEVSRHISPGHWFCKESSSTVLVRLLCGEQALLQRYMGAYSKDQAITLAQIAPQLSSVAMRHMVMHLAPLHTFVNIPAFSGAVLDQLAGLSQYLDNQRRSQQGSSSSSSSSITSTATCASSSLAHLQLGFNYKCLATEGTNSIPGDARRKAAEAHMAFLRAKPKTAAKSSNSSSTGGEQGSRVDLCRATVWPLLNHFISSIPSHKGSPLDYHWKTSSICYPKQPWSLCWTPLS